MVISGRCKGGKCAKGWLNHIAGESLVFVGYGSKMDLYRDSTMAIISDRENKLDVEYIYVYDAVPRKNTGQDETIGLR